ncbi:MAG: helix-turn-helix transcriptional regulator [Ruminococcaceae bacterium]|nr:helix-turn-helix transcriptional regulator [Oscillospiraceae bacterium]
MTFADNLQRIRKNAGFTQEELAERMEVSRQAVSKWESGQTFPELDKLIRMAEMFNCSLDELVRGEDSAAAVSKISAEEEAAFAGYCGVKMKLARSITLGVFLILLGVTLIVLSDLGTETTQIMATALLLLLIAAAVALFIVSGLAADNFKKKNPCITDLFPAEEKSGFDKHFAFGIAGGVAMILIGIVILIFLDTVFFVAEAVSACGMLVCINIGVCMIVYVAMIKDMYNVENYNKEQENSNGPDWSGAIMLIATAVFLACGFLFGLWHPAWVAFPIGGILCGVVDSLKKKK